MILHGYTFMQAEDILVNSSLKNHFSGQVPLKTVTTGLFYKASVIYVEKRLALIFSGLRTNNLSHSESSIYKLWQSKNGKKLLVVTEFIFYVAVM